MTMKSTDKQQFTTGAVRDTQENKNRYDLIPVTILEQLAEVFTEGALHYGDRNWQKGIPASRYYASCMRHLTLAVKGNESENHLIKAAWNLMAMKWTLDEVQSGKLPAELDDLESLL